MRIDLRSDTVTQPTPAMREAMCRAPVGDEQRGEDPTVNRLVEVVSQLLGKEDALFLPSGTMGNQVALRVFCRPGDEILMDRTAHVRTAEVGAAAALTGATIGTLAGSRGVFSVEQLGDAIQTDSRHAPRSRAVVIEQTANLGGGTVWPLEVMRSVAGLARERGLASHLDGARLFNAVVATGVPASDFAGPFDSICIDFSKGLGAPVGATLAGSRELIAEAWRWKQQFGGSMRQAGVLAAGALHGLERHVERLSDDHAHARMLGEGLRSIDGLVVEPVETNMVFFDVSRLGCDALTFVDRVARQGVLLGARGGGRVRAVTHLDISRTDIVAAIEILGRAARGGA